MSYNNHMDQMNRFWFSAGVHFFYLLQHACCCQRPLCLSNRY